MKKIMMMGAAILALQAIPAFAQGPADGKHIGGPGKFFEMQDTDKDGTVSEAEFLDASKKKFTEMDADKDGKITKEEMATRKSEMKKKWEARRAEMKAKKEAAPAGETPAVEKPKAE